VTVAKIPKDAYWSPGRWLTPPAKSPFEDASKDFRVGKESLR
jgi:hypothetical protein